MLAHDLGCKAHCLIWAQCAVCEHIDGKLIVIRHLTDTGILYLDIDTLNRCVDRIYCDNTD